MKKRLASLLIVLALTGIVLDEENCSMFLVKEGKAIGHLTWCEGEVEFKGKWKTGAETLFKSILEDTIREHMYEMSEEQLREMRDKLKKQIPRKGKK